MKLTLLSSIAILLLFVGLTACSPTPPAATTTGGDAMKGDAMKDKNGDAMKGDAMKGDAMKDKKGGAMKKDGSK